MKCVKDMNSLFHILNFNKPNNENSIILFNKGYRYDSHNKKY